jgi:hypothetical protein
MLLILSTLESYKLLGATAARVVCLLAAFFMTFLMGALPDDLHERAQQSQPTVALAFPYKVGPAGFIEQLCRKSK